MTSISVLVAYGTKNGSTASIADIIANTLSSDGIRVTVLPAAQVRDVSGYDAVILGGALYNGSWHDDARSFAKRYAAALAGRPVWLFSSGPLDTSADTGQIAPVRQAAEAQRLLAARHHVTFGGRLTEQAKGFIARAMVRNGKGGDFRNALRITAWARGIAEELRAQAAPASEPAGLSTPARPAPPPA